MAVIALTSASGSPGVTTTCVGLTLVWPRPCLLVEADPTGGSAVLAGFFRGDVPRSQGLIDIAFAHRQGAIGEALPSVSSPFPSRTDARFIPGIRSHTQAVSLAAMWEPLLVQLRALEANGQDVLVDAGRLGLTGSPEPVLAGADATVLVTRTDLPAVAAARSWSDWLRQARPGTPTGLLLIGSGRPYGARDVAKVLGLPVMASIAWAPDGSGVFTRGETPGRRFESGALVRSLHSAAAALRTASTANPLSTSERVSDAEPSTVTVGGGA